MGKHDLVKFGDVPSPLNDPKKIVADVTQLTKNVEWTQKYDLDAGLEKTIHWWGEKAGDIQPVNLADHSSLEGQK